MTDDELGRLVRDTWIAWALEQPDIADHPGWITPWDALPSRDKDVCIVRSGCADVCTRSLS